jgi:hypothetical protein
MPPHNCKINNVQRDGTPEIRSGADKSLTFAIFLFAAQAKELLLMG